MSDSGIQIRFATDEDQDAITASFNQHFLQNEPMNTYLKDYKPANLEPEEVPNHGQTFIAEAVDGSSGRKMAGFLICKTQTEPFVQKELPNPDDNRVAFEIVRLLRELKEPFDVVKLYGVEAFELYILSTVPDFRGRSVGLKLCQHAMDYAMSKGHKVVFIDCSSAYSGAIARKLDMKCIAEISYEEYQHEIGERLFDVKEPHTHLRRFVKEAE